MSKDTIYIDVDDDITAIIGKVKSAKSKIVALVPPKRIGVLQSAVNLRLLARAAKQGGKHLVLISGNSALTALASSAGIPSARTLQSKPVLVPLPDRGDDSAEDVIDGVELPVGDLARTAEEGEGVSIKGAPAIDSAIRANAAEEAAATSLVRPRVPTGKSGIKVPNFDTFRKKFILVTAAVLLLGGFLVWAIGFAPRANIVITARTIESSANPKVVLATSATTDADAGTLKAVRQEVKRDVSLEFTATGEKEVGEKAKGEVIFRNCEDESSITIQSGTGVSAGGKTYITQATVVVPGGSGTWFSGCNPGVSDPVSIVAQEIGDEYNIDEGAQFSVAGHPDSGSKYLRATAETDIDGGSKKKVTVVTKEDVDKAATQAANQDMESIKKQLTDKFGGGVVVLDASFDVNKGGVTSTPAVGAEATDGKARLGGSVSYTMLGVAESEASKFLDAYFTKQIKDGDNQRVYNNGAEKTTFVDVAKVDSGYTATMTATATLGPKIDDATVKSEARGKKYGEVQSAIEGISGIESVDVEFSPFWVKTVPQDEERITIEFNLDESK